MNKKETCTSNTFAELKKKESPMKCLKPKRKYLFLSQNELYIYKKCYLFLTAYAESSGPTSRNFPAPVLKMWCQVLQPLPPKKPWLTSRPWKTSTKWKCRKQKKTKRSRRKQSNETNSSSSSTQSSSSPTSSTSSSSTGSESSDDLFVSERENKTRKRTRKRSRTRSSSSSYTDNWF